MRFRFLTCLALALSLLAAGNLHANLSDGLVAYYPLDGNTNDASGMGNNGTASGNILFAAGRVGQAAVLDGLGDKILIPDSPSLHFGAGPFTLSCWIKTDSGSGAFPIDKDYTDVPSGTYRLYLNHAAGAVSFWIQDASSGFNVGQVTSTTLVADNAWHHIVGVRDKTAGVLRVYVDGVESATPVADNLIQSTDNSQSLALGGASLNDQYMYQGLLDEVRIYNRALSAGEISELYALADGSSGEGLSLSKAVGLNDNTMVISGIRKDGVSYVTTLRRIGSTRLMLLSQSMTVSQAPVISNATAQTNVAGADCPPDFPQSVMVRFDFTDPNGDLVGGYLRAGYEVMLKDGSGPISGGSMANFFPSSSRLAIQYTDDGTAGTVTGIMCYENVSSMDLSIVAYDGDSNASNTLSLLGITFD